MSELDGELDQGTGEGPAEVLTDATATADDVFVAVWEVWGDVPLQRFPGAARVDTEAHFLLRGPLHGVLTTAPLDLPSPSPPTRDRRRHLQCRSERTADPM